MDHLTSPVTLLVKAPNQKINDQTVECFLDWTVKRLKSHLAAVYPSRPDEKHQKIIYSGKLLQDNVTLKDVLRVMDDRLHTVHLVCSPCVEEKSTSPSQSQTTACSSSVSTTSSNSTTSSAATSRRPSTADSTTSDGLRHRTNHQNSAYFNYSNPYMQQPYVVSGDSSPAAYTQQQMQWMQQMYAQQMAAYYMQYSGNGMPGMVSPWSPGVVGANIPQPFQQVPINNLNLPPQQPAADVMNNDLGNNGPIQLNQPQRPAQNQAMNAGVGPAMNDEEEDGIHRDWLDWVFTFCRFGVLISVVYFYSSMNRFLLVGGVMLLVYLYEQGFFQLRRRQGGRGATEPTPAAAPGPGGDNENQEETDEPSIPNDEGADTEGASSDSPDTAQTTPPQEVEPPRPGVMATAWIFISTFFTSLIPQGPQQLAA